MSVLLKVLLGTACVVILFTLWLAGEIPVGKFWRDPEWWRSGAPAWVEAIGTATAAFLALEALRKWGVQESARREADMAEKLLGAASEAVETLNRATVWREKGWEPRLRSELDVLMTEHLQDRWIEVGEKLGRELINGDQIPFRVCCVAASPQLFGRRAEATWSRLADVLLSSRKFLSKL